MYYYTCAIRYHDSELAYIVVFVWPPLRYYALLWRNIIVTLTIIFTNTFSKDFKVKVTHKVCRVYANAKKSIIILTWSRDRDRDRDGGHMPSTPTV